MNSRLALVFVLALASAASAGKHVSKKEFKKLAMHSFWASCWGKDTMKGFYKETKKYIGECNQLMPSFDIDFGLGHENNHPAFGGGRPQTLPGFLPQQDDGPTPTYEDFLAFLRHSQRSEKRPYARLFKREAPSHEDVIRFSMGVHDYTEHMKDNIGNLTCVLAKLGALDKNLDINMGFYLQDLWQHIPDQPDPEFRMKVIKGYKDCYAIAQSIPKSVFGDVPFKQKFGPNHVFFECIGKVEADLCAKQEMNRFLEECYGPTDAASRVKMGLPADKFDAALFSFRVMEHEIYTDTEKFVWKTIMGENQ